MVVIAKYNRALVVARVMIVANVLRPTHVDIVARAIAKVVAAEVVAAPLIIAKFVIAYARRRNRRRAECRNGSSNWAGLVASITACNL